jgi:photosystem II stability/assembly factor-like uncharacterized protein
MAIRSLSRRTFLKVAGLTASALLLAPGSAQGAGNYFIVQTEALGRQYRGTRDGLVFESVDGGRNWQQVANFGSHCVVQALHQRQDQLVAQVGVAGYAFALTSRDARTWHTV